MKSADVRAIAVIGLGKMGCDWIVNLLEGGYTVIGFDASQDQRDSAAERVETGLRWVQKKRHPDQSSFVSDKKQRFSVVPTEDAFVRQAAQQAQIFLEVVFEDLELKCQMLRRIAPQLPSHMLLWTNTSSLSIHTMALASGNPKNFIGTHGMNPVYQMPAVEVIRHKDIAQTTIDTTLEILTSIGKNAFVATDVAGFWVNKQLIPFILEAVRALERGEISVEGGDIGLQGSLGHPQGVFKLADFIGNDTLYRVAVAMYLATQDPRCYPPALLARMFKNKEWGVKSAKGFYLWDGFKATKPRDFSDQAFTKADTILEV